MIEVSVQPRDHLLDVRVAERNVKARRLSPEDLAHHLAALPDRTGHFEPLRIDQDAEVARRAEERETREVRAVQRAERDAVERAAIEAAAAAERAGFVRIRKKPRDEDEGLEAPEMVFDAAEASAEGVVETDGTERPAD